MVKPTGRLELGRKQLKLLMKAELNEKKAAAQKKALAAKNPEVTAARSAQGNDIEEEEEDGEDDSGDETDDWETDGESKLPKPTRLNGLNHLRNSQLRKAVRVDNLRTRSGRWWCVNGRVVGGGDR